MAKILGQFQLNTWVCDQLEAAVRPFWLTCYKSLINHWVTVESTQTALSSSPCCFLWHRDQAEPHVKSPLLQLRQGPTTMLQTCCLCLASWQISEALTYPKHALTHIWKQHCVYWASSLAWFTAKAKKHGRSRSSRSFLTGSGNSINVTWYQPFQLSLSIYSCSIQRHFEWE